MAEVTVLLEWPETRQEKTLRWHPKLHAIAINLAHQHLIFRPPLKGSNEGELQRSPQWLDFAPPVGFFSLVWRVLSPG